MDFNVLLITGSSFVAGFIFARALARKRVKNYLKKVNKNIDNLNQSQFASISENDIWKSLNKEQLHYTQSRAYSAQYKQLKNLLETL